MLALLTVAALAWVVLDRGDGADEPTASSDAPATTTTAPPVHQASDEEPLRILVAGDSMVGWIAPALETALAGRPVEIIHDWKGSTGLARPDYFDWPARLAEDVAAHDPDVVIVGFGGNDSQNLTTDDGVIVRGEPAWQEEYGRRVAEVLDTVEAPGRTVWWIGMPLTQSDDLEASRPAITDAVLAQLADRPWATYVDTVDVLTPDGAYVVSLPGPDGEDIRVRADDGVHPSVGGGELIVASFLDDLRTERGL